MTENLHKVFLSFHHGNRETDAKCGLFWKDKFEALFHKHYSAIISRSVKVGDIKSGLLTETTRQIIRDKYIAEASVTIVLIGPETWKRKHVDWEISSSIKKTEKNPRCGLLGILLPTYKGKTSENNLYNPKTIPPRLYKNIEKGYASIHKWNEDPKVINKWVHEAFKRRNLTPDNSYTLFGQNRKQNKKEWQ